MINRLIENIRGKGVKIVFTEGSDSRVLEATVRLHREDIVHPILLGSRKEIEASAASLGLSVEGMEIIDPLESDIMDSLVIKMVELRKGKMDEDACRAALEKTNYFGTMYVKMGYADGLLGGATYSTADTVRPALQLVKTNRIRASFPAALS